MPGVQTLLNEMNCQFTEGEIERLAARREEFAQGQRLVGALIDKKHRLHPVLRRYLRQLPEAIQEALRSTIYHALGKTDLAGKSRAPRQITFAWMPGFDYEITVTDVGNTKETPGGITVLLKSPYNRAALSK